MLHLCDGQATGDVGLATTPPSLNGIELRALPPGEEVVVETRNSRYRFVMLDGTGGNVLAQGGHYFPQQTIARIEGSTRGEHPVHAGWIELGLSVELSLRGERIVTTSVQSISVNAASA